MVDIGTKDSPAGAPAEPAGPTAPAPRWWRGGRFADAVVPAIFALVALYVTARYWKDPGGRVSGANPADQTLFEWMLAHAARSVSHLENPLVSDRLGAPEGVNAIGNTSMLGMSIPLAPVTLLWGPTAAYAAMITVGFAATAAAWYFVLSRYAGLSRFAAFAGAGFCAFAPGVVSQGAGHPHMQVQFLLPIIAWRVFRLRASARPARDGVVLGLLVTWQVFIGEEALFIAALACAVCVLVHAVARRRDLAGQVRPFLTGLGVAAAVAGALLAYPLYVQFFGPRSYGHLPWIPNFRADLAAYPAFSPLSLAGDPSVERTPLAQDRTELNAFFGWPLLVVVPAIVGWLWRDLAARTAAVVAVVFAAFSLGHEITVNGEPTGVPGPWWLFYRLPVVEHVVTTRFALVTAAAIGVLLALVLDRALRSPGPRLLGVPRAALAWTALVAAALLPAAPRPLPAEGAPRVPAFFTGGAYEPYVAGDGAVMVVPPTRPQQQSATRWAASELVAFRITEGRFLAPAPGAPDRRGILSRTLTPVGQLAVDAGQTGTVPPVTDADRAAARDEMRRRGVAIVVLPADQDNGAAVRATMDALLGPGRLVEDVWVWDVRAGR